MEDNQKGIALALLTALISGVAVFVNGYAVKLADPVAYTLLKNAGALALLAAVAFAFADWRHFRSLSGRQWAMLALIGIVGGSIPFAMFFTGLSLGGPAVSSFIFRSLFIFAGVFGWLLLKEKPERRDAAAGFIMLAGNALLVQGDLMFGTAQLLVLGATLLWALEYTISRKILSEVHPRAVMLCRMLFGSLVLVGFMAYEGSLGALLAADASVLQWLAVTSLLLCGFLVSWYTALKHLPVFRATAILALGGIVTSALDYSFLGRALSIQSALGLTLLLIGAAIAAGVSGFASALRRSKPSPGRVE
ncbi:MAG: DMT family transporter [Candidatus Micrarchaeota archaeon]